MALEPWSRRDRVVGLGGIRTGNPGRSAGCRGCDLRRTEFDLSPRSESRVSRCRSSDCVMRSVFGCVRGCRSRFIVAASILKKAVDRVARRSCSRLAGGSTSSWLACRSTLPRWHAARNRTGGAPRRSVPANRLVLDWAEDRFVFDLPAERWLRGRKQRFAKPS